MMIYALALILALFVAGDFEIKRVLRFVASPVTEGWISVKKCEYEAVAFLCDVFIVFCVMADLIQGAFI